MDDTERNARASAERFVSADAMPVSGGALALPVPRDPS
jgi:hypothetical protein